MRQLLTLLSVSWLVSAIGVSAQPAPMAELPPGATSRVGSLVFTQCKACHSATPGAPSRIGPNLWGLIDRPIASVVDFSYSPALKAHQGRWTLDTLNQFLAAPSTFAPGTRMAFPGVRSTQQRASVIAYLHTLSETPVTLPHASTGHASQATADPFGDTWPDGPGRELSGYLCNSCHSLAIVKQQGLSRDDWDELLDVMVKEHGMVKLDPEQLDQVLTYLSTHFNINKNAR